ncbi:MAG: hypothetical protein LJE94_00140 [Deltaproteobacteria bacterium]|nr:hypothetical protein [Deltaproteobacteria bacterium]
MAEKIRQYVEKGILPGPDVRHYIASTFSHPTRRDLQTILNDRGNCERETLLELIFFPDLELQVALEDTIEAGRFHRDAEADVLRRLMRKKPVAAFFYPDENAAVRFALPEDAARQFIARLHISKDLPGDLREAVDGTLQGEDRLRARVMIRNARFACRGAGAAFLASLFISMDGQPAPLFECLEFVLHFLETVPPDSDLKTALAARKQRYRNHLLKAGYVEKMRGSRNAETLMVQGVRLPHCDPGDAMRKIVMLDAVALAIYGQTL